jgi:hypothetical protein
MKTTVDADVATIPIAPSTPNIFFHNLFLHPKLMGLYIVYKKKKKKARGGGEKLKIS